MNDLVVAPYLDAIDFGIHRELHAVLPQGLLDPCGGVRILFGQDLRMIAQDMDPGPETGKGLGQLATNRPGADHRQPRRQLRQGEDRLIGEEACLCQSGDRRPMGAGTGGDHGPAEAEWFAGHLHRVRAGERGLPEVDIDAKAAESSRRIVRADAGSQPAHPLHDAGKIDPHAGRNVDPELCGITNLGGDPGGPEQRLGRHATNVKAVAPQEFPLDQGHSVPSPAAPAAVTSPAVPAPITTRL